MHYIHHHQNYVEDFTKYAMDFVLRSSKHQVFLRLDPMSPMVSPLLHRYLILPQGVYFTMWCRLSYVLSHLASLVGKLFKRVFQFSWIERLTPSYLNGYSNKKLDKFFHNYAPSIFCLNNGASLSIDTASDSNIPDNDLCFDITTWFVMKVYNDLC